jgi:hypothetical protein
MQAAVDPSRFRMLFKIEFDYHQKVKLTVSRTQRSFDDWKKQFIK